MTPADIDALPAGVEMDALIAEKVMGWKPNAKHPNLIGDGWWDCGNGEFSPMAFTPPYSTDDAAALEVFKKTPKPEYAEILVIHFNPAGKPEPSHSPIYEVGWQTGDDLGLGFVDGQRGKADTLALAICRAVLRAVAPPA